LVIGRLGAIEAIKKEEFLFRKSYNPGRSYEFSFNFMISMI